MTARVNSHFVKIPIESREQWLALRKTDITASIIPALFGVSKYQTPLSVYALKTGMIEEDPDEPHIDDASITLSPMARGLLAEEPAVELLRRLKPTWTITKGEHYYRDPTARIGATPDLLVEDPERGLGTINIKNPEQSIYRRWKQDGVIDAPLEFAIQVNLEAHLTGAKWAAIGAIIFGHRTEFRLIDVPLKPKLIERIYAEVADFWGMVERGTPPSADYARDGETLAALYDADDGTESDLSGWNAGPSLAAERDDLKEQIKAGEKRCSEISTEFKEKLGNHSTGVLADGRVISWKTQHRKGHVVEPKDIRVLRVGKPHKNLARLA